MIVDLKSCQSLIRPVMDHARNHPDRVSTVFIHENGAEGTYSAAQFHEEASGYSRALAASGLKKGDLAILVMGHRPALLFTFWGALYLGAVPSIFPILSEKLDPEYYAQQLIHLITRSGAQAIIVDDTSLARRVSELTTGGCRIIEASSLLNVRTATGPYSMSFANGLDSREKAALLQHSSGTTGLQKGVVLTHGALLNQIEAYSRAIDLDGQDTIISWLPLYHDMGLIAGFILPLVMGVPLVLMSPFYWVRDPKQFLLAVAKFRGTLCWLPNFAYNHMVRAVRMRDLEGIDLSSLRMAINCSEPVRWDSHQKFIERFSPFGISEEKLSSCYAMAENTFAVTQCEPGRSPKTDWVDKTGLQEQLVARPVSENSPGAVPVVSCGIPLENTEVRIVGPEHQLLASRHVGEIIIRGNSMLEGYHNRPGLTGQAIRIGWFFTGDLGYLADGELYVTGRKKDLIIVGGKNIYPADLEAIANGVDGIYPGRAVAFGVPDERMGTESVVMVCELANAVSENEKAALEKELRKKITQESGITLGDVRLMDGKWLIKTSSGKIARRENRAKYLQFTGSHR